MAASERIRFSFVLSPETVKAFKAGVRESGRKQNFVLEGLMCWYLEDQTRLEKWLLKFGGNCVGKALGKRSLTKRKSMR